MTFKIIFNVEAVEELEDIYNFYFDKSPKTADKIYHTILSEINKYLRNTPELAAIEPRLTGEKETYRSLIVYKGLFKIIYYVKAESVVITQIWCCRRNPADMTG